MGTKKDVAIKVDGISKEFMLPHEKHSSLKTTILNSFSKRTYEHQQALSDVSFEVEKGDFFGIVGKNGSGKSTLLKCIAGVYSPSSGSIEINGTLVPFIELGVGFNPELSGRDNVYLNGALLGFSRQEVSEMYDDIVEFAELEQFMDQKLKNYSSGMHVRLGFSIAIRAQSDILLLDEVLAVGDEAFQRKCYDYFNQLKYEGKTVVLVTHSMSAIESFCNKAMLIDNSKVSLIGGTHEVASAYSKLNDEAITRNKNKENEDNNPDETTERFTTKILNDNHKPQKVFHSGDNMIVQLEWQQDNVQNAGIAIVQSDGRSIYATNTYIENKSFKNKKMVEYSVRLNLQEGDYIIKTGLFAEHDKLRVAFNDEAARITVNRNTDDYRWHGVTRLESEWSVNV